jgi:hypothetical protein
MTTTDPQYTPPPETVDAFAAVGWRVLSVRPTVGATGSVTWSATVARVDGASMSLAGADPAAVLEELLRYATADEP